MASKLYTRDDAVNQINTHMLRDLDSVRLTTLRRRGSIAPQASQFIDQKFLLFLLALLEVDPEEQDPKANQAEREEEIKRSRVIVTGARINNGARDDRPDEGRGFADDAEQAEKEELVASRCDLRYHNLRVAVPGTDEEAIVRLVNLC